MTDYNQVKTLDEAVAAQRRVAVAIVEHGRVEIGTPESALVISVCNYLKRLQQEQKK